MHVFLLLRLWLCPLPALFWWDVFQERLPGHTQTRAVVEEGEPISGKEGYCRSGLRDAGRSM